MDKEALIGELKTLLKEYLLPLNFILVDILSRYERGSLYLTVLADRPQGGITLDECAELNRDIGDLIEEKSIIMGSYILEVSSPGLDRPLKTSDDFSRFTRQKVKFFLNEAVNGKLEWDGLIDNVNPVSVSVITAEGIIDIPYLKINKAKLII